MSFNYGKKRSAEDAAKEADGYVEPRECFIWYINNKWGWQSFSTTGDTPCAHYVAHQLGLTAIKGVTCKLGFLVRVDDLVARLGAPIDVADVRVGDVWARLKGAARDGGGNEPTSHCGMVSRVEHQAAAKPVVTVKHCSSGQRKVAENDWTTHFGAGGRFYRLPSRESSVKANVNLQRFAKGFSYRPPFSSHMSS